MKNINIGSGAFSGLIQEIRQIVLSARKLAVRNVDTLQVIANYEVGRRIVNYEQQGKKRAEYGEKILVGLSDKLTQEFGRGFSKTNLKLMRQFYLIYGGRIGQMPSDQFTSEPKSNALSVQLPKSQMPSGKLSKPAFSLSWSQYVFLIGERPGCA